MAEDLYYHVWGRFGYARKRIDDLGRGKNGFNKALFCIKYSLHIRRADPLMYFAVYIMTFTSSLSQTIILSSTIEV